MVTKYMQARNVSVKKKSINDAWTYSQFLLCSFNFIFLMYCSNVLWRGHRTRHCEM